MLKSLFNKRMMMNWVSGPFQERDGLECQGGAFLWSVVDAIVFRRERVLVKSRAFTIWNITNKQFFSFYLLILVDNNSKQPQYPRLKR